MKIQGLQLQAALDETLALPKVGMIVLSTDLTCERDFAKQQQFYINQGKKTFDYYINRIEFTNPMTRNSLKAMLPEISKTVEQILPRQSLDAVVFNCTSASALLGDEMISTAIHNIQPNTKVITTASAAVQQLFSKGHQKISLLAPYTQAISVGLAEYFETNGLEVVMLSHLDIEDDNDVAKLQTDQIIKAAKEAIVPEAEALFISCTATPVLNILPEISSAISKPCYCSNQSTFIQTLRAVYA